MTITIEMIDRAVKALEAYDRRTSHQMAYSDMAGVVLETFESEMEAMCADRDDLRARLEAEIVKPIPVVKLEAGDAYTRDLMADRDEWRQQHENLLAMYRASEAELHRWRTGHQLQAFQHDLGMAQAEISELRATVRNQRKELHAKDKAQLKAYADYESRIEAQVNVISALKDNLLGTQRKVTRIAALLARFTLPDECDEQCNELVRDFCLHCVDILKRDHEPTGEP